MQTKDFYEASPSTLGGSFTPDLVTSKLWLARKVRALMTKTRVEKYKTVYVLGSWFGNMAIFLQQKGVEFDRIVLVDINKDWMQISKELLEPITDKLDTIIQDANKITYSDQQPILVINTSCNEMANEGWLDRIPAGSTVALQARNNVQSVDVVTDTVEEFNNQFPLSDVFYLGERKLRDPEVSYQRFMKIGIK
jgi:hypothetical protein